MFNTGLTLNILLGNIKNLLKIEHSSMMFVNLVLVF